MNPVTERIRRVAQFDPGDNDAARLDKLEQLLALDGTQTDADLPPVAELLGVPLDERYTAPGGSAEHPREQLLDVFESRAVALSRRPSGATSRTPQSRQ